MREDCLVLKVVFISLLLKAPFLYSQEGKPTPPDTGRVNADFPVVRTTPIFPDTTNVVHDTVAVKQATSGIDSIITYSASDSIVYSLHDRTMHLFGKGSIQYKELGLKAEKIDIDWTTSSLQAQGVPDTADTTGKGFKGLPDLIDGSETYKGTTVSYNFKTKRGRINLGETEVGDGFYSGEKIKKVDNNVLFVENGRYTTCELGHPHYYIASPEMKIVVKDQVVARPVYLYISDVPVLALPFGVFPSQSGRRSGLIVPSYGQDSRGRFLNHMGVFWATNDYTDWTLLGDGWSNGSWVLHSTFRYALRYDFSGNVTASFGRSFTGERGDPTFTSQDLFNLSILHHQDLDPTAHIDVNFTFTSGSYYQNTSYDYSDLLQQTIISNATLQKSWEGTPNSFTLNVSRTQDLQTGAVTNILPSVSFSRSQSYPFRFGKETGSGAPQTWYELIGYSYTGQFRNVQSKTLSSLTGNLDYMQHDGVQHTLPVNASPKIGYFTLTPFFNYTEKWYHRSIRKEFNPADSTVTTSEVKGFQAVRFFDTGATLGTKLYGIVQPGILGITGIRHQLTPSISYTYQPDFSKSSYGYWGTYTDALGTQIPYSFYEQEVFGGSPAGERQAIGFRLGNVFEMKTAGPDTAKEENKFQLLNLDVSSSYNFAKDSLKFDEISLGYRTSIGDLLNIGGSSRFNLYKFELDPGSTTTGRRVNKFLIDEEGRLAQLTSFSISISTKLSGEKSTPKVVRPKSEADSLEQQPESGYIGLYGESKPDFSIPWNLDLTWNFNQSQPNPHFITRTSTVAAMLSFNLTDFWKITASGSYDVLNRVFAAPQVTVYRDLHCWEMNFTWVPTGQYQNFRIEIRLKSPLLHDVKVTKQTSGALR